MRLFTPGSLLLGLLLSAPTLMSTWNDPGADIAGALGRFLLAVVVAGAGLSFLRGIVTGYQATASSRDRDGATTITTLPAAAPPVVVASDDVLPA